MCKWQITNRSEDRVSTSRKSLHSSPMISISKPLCDHDVRTIEKMKEERFITTPHVWYRPSDLQKRARFFFPKMQIIPRLAGCSRCRAGINWEEWAGDGDDIQIRARRKWRKYTYDTHPSYITRNWLVFRYRGIEFRLHPGPTGIRLRESKDPGLHYPDIRYYVAQSGMTSLLVWQTIGWLAVSDRGFCK